MEDLIEWVVRDLIRADGKLNSPSINSSKNSNLIEAVRGATSFLPLTATFAQRWWHIRNKTDIPPTCIACSQVIEWSTQASKYNQYCTQLCAVTSPQATERTRAQFKGKSVPKERSVRSRRSRIQNGYYKDRDSTTLKLREQKVGALNPSYGKDPWNKGLTGALNPLTGRKRPGSGRKGAANHMYGKSPSIRAGRGINGKFNNMHFRSSLELMYLMYWYESLVEVISAEGATYRTEYTTAAGLQRTYSPDFFIPGTNTLVEIKPERLHTNCDVVLKFEALAQKHCDKHCELLGFAPISQFICTAIRENLVDAHLASGVLDISDTQLIRLRKNYGDIVRAAVKQYEYPT